MRFFIKYGVGKKKGFSKKITHMQRWHKPQNFLLAFIDVWKTWKSEFWKTEKKLQEISSFYRCAPKTTIIWGRAPEIRSEIIFFTILGHFLPFTPPPPPNNQENQNFEKMKTTYGGVISLTCAAIQSNDVAYSDMECNRHIFCHFRSFFALLPHYWPQILKFGKNVKNIWRYYPSTHVHHKSRSYDDSWDMEHDKHIFSHFGSIFALLPLHLP